MCWHGAARILPHKAINMMEMLSVDGYWEAGETEHSLAPDWMQLKVYLNTLFRSGTRKSQTCWRLWSLAGTFTYIRRARPGPKEYSDPATLREQRSLEWIPPSSAPYPSVVSCVLPTAPASPARLLSIPAAAAAAAAPEEEAAATSRIISRAPSAAALTLTWKHSAPTARITFIRDQS